MDAVVGLGSNLGDRRGELCRAVLELRKLGALSAVSCLYETTPIGPPQPLFLNAAVRLVTSLDPPALLAALLDIERGLGRIRGERWGPRLIDLDILWIEAVTVDTPELSVPHPELRRRAFALRPLLDVAPSATDPRDGEFYGSIVAGLRAETELMLREDAGSWACIDMPLTRW